MKLVKKQSLTPTLVRGAAGTGKTVVAMHRAVELIRRPDWDPNEKLLFTTFTTNLTVDIEQQLQLLCSPDEMKRIEVTNVNAWVGNFLRRHKVNLKIVYPESEDYEKCWSRALAVKPPMRLSDAFVREEWERIILPKNITTEIEYMTASRRGRGISITRSERKALWPVFEEMRYELSQRKFLTSEDACFLAISLIKQEGNLNHYGAVVVDETQDLGPEALTLLAALAKKYPVGDKEAEPCIFLVGDGHQRIYSRVASLSACGINVRGGRSSRLKVTYRTTEETRRIANAVLLDEPFDDMDGGSETLAGNRSIRHGRLPELYQAQDFDDEVDWIAKKVEEVRMDNPNYQTSDICIVARTKKLIHSYQEALENKGYRVVSVARNKADDTTSGLRAATMHRVKGLEFKVIFIAGANEGTMPLIKDEKSDDEMENKLAMLQERSLFYVSASRARDLLFISCSGLPGDFMKLLSKEKP